MGFQGCPTRKTTFKESMRLGEHSWVSAGHYWGETCLAHKAVPVLFFLNAP
jgi:hypothetical protein